MALLDCPEIEDYADEPGLRQVFPVVLPLSDKRLGPQDVRHPKDAHGRLRNAEERYDDWLFRRDRSQAEATRHERLAHGHRLRAEEAERTAYTAEAAANERVVNIEAAAEDRRRRGKETEEELLANLQEAVVRRGEAERERADRIAEAEMLLANERAHTADVEGLLRQEQQRSEEAWRRARDVEEASRRRLAERDADVERERLEAQQRIEAAQAVAEKRLREAQERCAVELESMRRQVEEQRGMCTERVELEARRKLRMEEDAVSRRGIAAMRLDTDRQRMRQTVNQQFDSCRGVVDRFQRREEDTADSVETWQAGAVSKIFGEAAKRSHDAHKQEVHSTQSLEHAVHNLGRHYSTQRQYNTTVDSKVCSILQGTLHGHLTAHGHLGSGTGGLRVPGGAQTARGPPMASPSPRNLGPPSARVPIL